MNKQLIINFLTKDMHIQKDVIDYDALYDLVEKGVCSVGTMKLTPKNKEKVERKLGYLDALDLAQFETNHLIDDYSIAVLRSKYGLLPKLKNKMVYDNHIYKFIFDYYYYKHEIDYMDFVNFDNDHMAVAKELDININLILEKTTKTLEQLSRELNCTRESVRLRIIDAKRFVTTRFQLPAINYVLDTEFDDLDYMDKIILLSYHDQIWNDQFKSYIISPRIIKKITNFTNEIQKLKNDYEYQIGKVENTIYPLIENYVNNDNNLYIDNKHILSLVRNGEHHNANYILNYLKICGIDQFYIEDLLHDDFLSTTHGELMSASITTSLRNLEAILDREEVLVKVDTHIYKKMSSIPNIDLLNHDDLIAKLSDAPDVVNIELLSEIFADEIDLLEIEPKGFYYILKKLFFAKFKFRKLVIYNSEYKLQTKYEILAAKFDTQKVIVLDDNLLPNATNLARKFRDKGGLIYGDKLYNTNLLDLSTKLRNLDIKPNFDDVVFRSNFNRVIDDIILDEIDFKRKFAFKLWSYLNDYEYFNFYARKDSKYPELHTLVYAINSQKNKITYTQFIDTIEEISGSRKVYQILQNMIDSELVECITSSNDNKIIKFKVETISEGSAKPTTSRINALTVDQSLDSMTVKELRVIAKSIHLKNINKYNKKELISILRNTIKITEL